MTSMLLTGVGGDFRSSSFSPSSISGLKIWLRADLGVTISTGVSTWADQSGNGNDATQATGSKQPAQTASIINGQTVIRFDGSNDILLTGSVSLTVYNIFLIGKNVGSTGKRWLNTRITSADGASFNPTDTTHMRFGETGISGTDYSDGTAQYFSGVVNGGSDSITVNSTTTTGTVGTATFSGLTIGAYSDGVSHAQVDIAEICVYDSEITGANLTNLRSYFTTRYGTP